MKNIRFKSAWLLLVGSFLIISSCSKKDDGHYGPSSDNKQASQEQKIKQLIKRLPLTKLLSAEQHRRSNAARTAAQELTGGWDFSNPSNSTTWSSPSGVTYSQSTNTVFLSPGSFGGSAGSVGTVVAGPSSLDINGTFCFSADFSGNNLDLFNMGFSGVSGVIGVSGDFGALANANSNTSFTDIFHGLAYYIVYDSHASGSYTVVDWFGANLGNNNSLQGACFAFVFDFQNGRLFMSSSGTINVSGGSMNFNGQYFEISGFLLGTNGIDTDNITFSEVPGFGTMGCN